MRIPFSSGRSFYFVGIGGIGMSALAYLLAKAGYRVGGSDKRKDFATKRYLEEANVVLFVGHSAEHIREGWNVCVYSSAIPKDNPELREACRLGLAVLHRSEVLGEFTRANTTVGITGAHGKTTTTAMVAYVLKHAGLDPSVVLGSTHSDLEGGNARLGGDILVAEIDESDGSMLNTHPYYPVITSVDREHLNNYGGSYENLLKAMEEYAMSSGSGTIVLNAAYPDLREMASRLRDRGYTVVTYGLNVPDAGISGELFREENGFALRVGGAILRLTPPLKYNYENALAAIATAGLFGIGVGDAVRILSGFTLPGRRFEKLGEIEGWELYHDYAHHPREIKALVEAARDLIGTGPGPQRKLWVVFQPHRYTRFCGHYEDFRELLITMPADKVFVMPVYSAGESPIEGCSDVSELVREVDSVTGRCQLVTFDDDQRLYQMLKEDGPGVLLLVGAGDVYKLGERLLSFSK